MCVKLNRVEEEIYRSANGFELVLDLKKSYVRLKTLVEGIIQSDIDERDKVVELRSCKSYVTRVLRNVVRKYEDCQSLLIYSSTMDFIEDFGSHGINLHSIQFQIESRLKYLSQIEDDIMEKIGDISA